MVQIKRQPLRRPKPLDATIKAAVEKIEVAEVTLLPEVLDVLADSWPLPRVDLMVWAPVLNRFDSILSQFLKTDSLAELLQRETGADASKLIVAILRFSKELILHCSNRGIYNSVEHVNQLFCVNDAEIVQAAALLALALSEQRLTWTKLDGQRLLILSQGWFSKGGRFGLAASSQVNAIVPEQAQHLRFEFYRSSLSELPSSSTTKQVDSMVHLDKLITPDQNPSDVFADVIREYDVPEGVHFALYHRIRLAAVATVAAKRIAWNKCRVLAIATLVNFGQDDATSKSFFLFEPEFASELVALITSKTPMPWDLKTYALYVLDGMANPYERPRLSSVLTAVRASANHGVLATLLRQIIASMTEPSTDSTALFPLTFIDALLSLILSLVNTPPGRAMLVSGGIIPDLIPMLAAKQLAHAKIVARTVRILDLLVFDSNSSLFGTFCDNNGLVALIERVQFDVDAIISTADAQDAAPQPKDADTIALLKVSLKFMLHALQQGSTADRLRHIIDGPFPKSLRSIMRRWKLFSGSVFATAVNIIATLIHNEPTSLTILQEAQLPDACLDVLATGIPTDHHAIAALPNAFSAFCLNAPGLAHFRSLSPFPALLGILADPLYLSSLTSAKIPGILGGALEELVRHHPDLREDAFAAVLSLLKKAPGLTDKDLTLTEEKMSLVEDAMDSTQADNNNAENGGPTSANAADAPSSTSPLLSVIQNIAVFLEAFLCSDSQVTDFIRLVGIEPVIDIVLHPHIPDRYDSLTSLQSMSTVVQLLSASRRNGNEDDNDKSPMTELLLIRAQAALDSLAPLTELSDEMPPKTAIEPLLDDTEGVSVWVTRLRLVYACSSLMDDIAHVARSVLSAQPFLGRHRQTVLAGDVRLALIGSPQGASILRQMAILAINCQHALNQLSAQSANSIPAAPEVRAHLRGYLSTLPQAATDLLLSCIRASVPSLDIRATAFQGLTAEKQMIAFTTGENLASAVAACFDIDFKFAEIFARGSETAIEAAFQSFLMLGSLLSRVLFDNSTAVHMSLLVHLYRKGILTMWGDWLGLFWKYRIQRLKPLESLDSSIAMILVLFEQLNNGRVVLGSVHTQPYFQLTEFADQRLDVAGFIVVVRAVIAASILPLWTSEHLSQAPHRCLILLVRIVHTLLEARFERTFTTDHQSPSFSESDTTDAFSSRIISDIEPFRLVPRSSTAAGTGNAAGRGNGTGRSLLDRDADLDMMMRDRFARVFSSGSDFNGLSTIRGLGPVRGTVNEDSLRQLTDMGFARFWAERALSQFNNNINTAADFLLRDPAFQTEPPASSAAATAAPTDAAPSGESSSSLTVTPAVSGDTTEAQPSVSMETSSLSSTATNIPATATEKAEPSASVKPEEKTETEADITAREWLQRALLTLRPGLQQMRQVLRKQTPTTVDWLISARAPMPFDLAQLLGLLLAVQETEPLAIVIVDRLISQLDSSVNVPGARTAEAARILSLLIYDSRNLRAGRLVAARVGASFVHVVELLKQSTAVGADWTASVVLVLSAHLLRAEALQPSPKTPPPTIHTPASWDPTSFLPSLGLGGSIRRGTGARHRRRMRQSSGNGGNFTLSIVPGGGFQVERAASSSSTSGNNGQFSGLLPFAEPALGEALDFNPDAEFSSENAVRSEVGSNGSSSSSNINQATTLTKQMPAPWVSVPAWTATQTSDVLSLTLNLLRGLVALRVGELNTVPEVPPWTTPAPSPEVAHSVDAILRLLVHLTRKPASAEQFVQLGGIETVLSTCVDSLFAGHFTLVIIILRHVAEKDMLESLMARYVRQMFADPNSRRTEWADVFEFIDDREFIVLRDPESFKRACVELCQPAHSHSSSSSRRVMLCDPNQPQTPPGGRSSSGGSNPLRRFHWPRHTVNGSASSPQTALEQTENDAVVNGISSALTHATAPTKLTSVPSIPASGSKQKLITDPPRPEDLPRLLMETLLCAFRDAFEARDSKKISVSVPNLALNDGASANGASATLQEQMWVPRDHFYRCFILQALQEIVQSYHQYREQFITLAHSIPASKKVTPSSMGSEVHRSVLDLLMEAIQVPEKMMTKLAATVALEQLFAEVLRARSLLATLCAAPSAAALSAPNSSGFSWDMPTKPGEELITNSTREAWKLVLTALHTAITDALAACVSSTSSATATEQRDVAHGRLFSLVYMVAHIVNDETNRRDGKQGPLVHDLGQIFVQTQFVPLLSNVLEHVDLNMPASQRFVESVLSSLETLTRTTNHIAALAAAKLQKSKDKSKSKSKRKGGVSTTATGTDASVSSTAAQETALPQPPSNTVIASSSTETPQNDSASTATTENQLSGSVQTATSSTALATPSTNPNESTQTAQNAGSSEATSTSTTQPSPSRSRRRSTATTANGNANLAPSSNSVLMDVDNHNNHHDHGEEDHDDDDDGEDLMEIFGGDDDDNEDHHEDDDDDDDDDMDNDDDDDDSHSGAEGEPRFDRDPNEHHLNHMGSSDDESHSSEDDDGDGINPMDILEVVHDHLLEHHNDIEGGSDDDEGEHHSNSNDHHSEDEVVEGMDIFENIAGPHDEDDHDDENHSSSDSSDDNDEHGMGNHENDFMHDVLVGSEAEPNESDGEMHENDVEEEAEADLMHDPPRHGAQHGLIYRYDGEDDDEDDDDEDDDEANESDNDSAELLHLFDALATGGPVHPGHHGHHEGYRQAAPHVRVMDMTIMGHLGNAPTPGVFGMHPPGMPFFVQTAANGSGSSLTSADAARSQISAANVWYPAGRTGGPVRPWLDMILFSPDLAPLLLEALNMPPPPGASRARHPQSYQFSALADDIPYPNRPNDLYRVRAELLELIDHLHSSPFAASTPGLVERLLSNATASASPLRQAALWFIVARRLREVIRDGTEGPIGLHPLLVRPPWSTSQYMDATATSSEPWAPRQTVASSERTFFFNIHHDPRNSYPVHAIADDLLVAATLVLRRDTPAADLVWQQLLQHTQQILASPSAYFRSQPSRDRYAQTLRLLRQSYVDAEPFAQLLWEDLVATHRRDAAESPSICSPENLSADSTLFHLRRNLVVRRRYLDGPVRLDARPNRRESTSSSRAPPSVASPIPTAQETPSTTTATAATSSTEPNSSSSATASLSESIAAAVSLFFRNGSVDSPSAGSAPEITFSPQSLFSLQEIETIAVPQNPEQPSNAAQPEQRDTSQPVQPVQQSSSDQPSSQPSSSHANQQDQPLPSLAQIVDAPATNQTSTTTTITPEAPAPPTDTAAPSIASAPVAPAEPVTLATLTRDNMPAPTDPAFGELVAAAGIDPTFLEALPDDLRWEVLSQHIPANARQSTTATALAANPSTTIDAEFLEALPDDIREEVLRDARHLRTQREQIGQNPLIADMDRASILASFEPGLRNDVLRDQDDAFLASLPPNLLAEQNNMHFLDPTDDPPVLLGNRLRGEILPVRGDNRSNRGETQPNRTELRPRANGPKLVDGPKQVEPQHLVALLRLLYLAQPMEKHTLQRTIAHLCNNSVTRSTTLALLLAIILGDSFGFELKLGGGPDGQALVGSQPGIPSNEVMEFDELAFATDSPTSVVVEQQEDHTAPTNNFGSSTPPLVVRRCLEVLLSLLSSGGSAGELVLEQMWKPVNMQELLKQALPNNKRSKGKGKDVVENNSAVNELVPFHALLGLLARSSLLNYPSVADVLLYTISFLTDPFAKGNVAGSGLTVPPETLRRLVGVLDLRTCSFKAFQHTLSTLQHLAAFESSRTTILNELVSSAEAIGRLMLADLQDLNNTLLPLTVSSSSASSSAMPTTEETDVAVVGSSADTIQRAAMRALTLPLLSSRQSAQSRLVRVLKAIAGMHQVRNVVVDPKSTDAAAESSSGSSNNTATAVAQGAQPQAGENFASYASRMRSMRQLMFSNPDFTEPGMPFGRSGQANDRVGAHRLNDDIPVLQQAANTPTFSAKAALAFAQLELDQVWQVLGECLEMVQLHRELTHVGSMLLPTLESYFIVIGNLKVAVAAATVPVSTPPSVPTASAVEQSSGEASSSSASSSAQVPSAESSSEPSLYRRRSMDGWNPGFLSRSNSLTASTLINGKKSEKETEDTPVMDDADKAAMAPLLPLCKSRLEKFDRFADKHRRVLNDLIRANPALISGSFALLTATPHLLDFDLKRNYFNQQLHNKKTREHHGTLHLHVRREYVFEDSYQQIMSHNGNEVKYSRLSVRFSGEEGVDAGGVAREWFQVLARQMFNPNFALFVASAVDKTTYQPNRLSGVNSNHLPYFKFVGRIIGKAIYDGRLLDSHFTRSFYKHMLRKHVDYRDMEAADPEFYKSLVWIVENNIDGVLDLTFSCEMDDFGNKREVDLKQDGHTIPVTEQNKMEYVKLITELKLTTTIRQQIDAFLQGFHEIIPPNLIAIFDEQELELLISGMPDIDIDDWRSNTEYQGYTASSPQIQWFWRAVRSFGREERAKLLQFVTGSSKIPLEGFSHLEGMNGIQKFLICKAYGKPTRLPAAHTCFNQLDLPTYESYDQLVNNLRTAILECNEGFGFA